MKIKIHNKLHEHRKLVLFLDSSYRVLFITLGDRMSEVNYSMTHSIFSSHHSSKHKKR